MSFRICHKIIFIGLCIIQAVCPVLAVDFGSIGHQEVGDVVFRKLSPMPIGKWFENVHSAIYKGYMRNYGDNWTPLMTFDANHDVIEMEGIRGSKFCKNSPIYRCVSSWGGIRVLDLRRFETMNPPYFGAFFSRDSANDIKATRAKVVEVAERLLSRDRQIPYIVIENEDVETLASSYFSYRKTVGSESVGIDQIERMRSDAFVEYCYAAAGIPIMPYLQSTPYDITIVTGAQGLVDMAVTGNLYPSYQRDRLGPSPSALPLFTVRDIEKQQLIKAGDVVRVSTPEVIVTDLASGISKLQQISGAGPFRINILQEINRPYYSKDLALNRETIYNFSEELEKFSDGLVTLRAYDHAGNYSDFAFTVAGNPVFGGPYSDPLYENFSGDTALIPSVLAGAHSFSFSDGIAGVSSVQMTGPPGNVISWTFDPPVTSTHTTLADMAPGQYSVKIINSVGGETTASFNLGSLMVGISTPASHQNISAPGDRLAGGALASVTLRAPLQSANELDRAELTDEQGRVLQTLNLAPNSSEASFSLPVSTFPEPLFLPSAYPEPPYTRYALKLWDKKGNYKRDFFTLALENFGRHEEPLTLPEGAPYVRGAIVDLQNYAGAFGPGNYTQLPGALVSPYYVKTGTNGVRSVDLGILASVTSYAPVDWETTPRPYMGSLTLKVRTGGQPNLSDAVEYTLISGPVYGSTTPIEGAYYVGLGYLTGTPLKIQSGRYIQAEAAFTPGLARVNFSKVPVPES